MSIVLDNKSVNYLRPDLEHNQLSKNAVPLVVGNAGYTLETTASVRTTGNAIMYLNGRLVCTSAGATSGDTLVSFPIEFAPIRGTRHYMIQRDSSSTYSAYPVRVIHGGSLGIVEALDTLLVGDFIYLNTIIYFRDS